MPTVVVTQNVLPALEPMTPLTGDGPGGIPEAQAVPGGIRFAWNDPPAAQSVTHISAWLWLEGGAEPTEPTRDFGLGTPLPDGRSYGEVTGLPGGAYLWDLTPGREE